MEQIIFSIEQVWDREAGFLGKLRDGFFDVKKGEEFLSLLNSIHLGNDDFLPKRLVELLWYIPIFMIWQKERLIEKESDVEIELYDRIYEQIRNSVTRILGHP